MAVKVGPLGKLPYVRAEVNPHRKKKARNPRRVKRNVSAKPKKRPVSGQQKGASMAKKKAVRNAAKRRTKASNRKKSIRYNFFANPRKRKSGKRRHHRPRSVSNPSRMRSRRVAGSALVQTVIAILRLGGLAFGSGFVVREGTQAALQSRNTGWMGYAGNFVATGFLMYIAKMFGSRADVIAVAAGGGVAIANRYTQTAANPVLESMSLSGLGDVSTFTARNSIRSALRGLPASSPAPGQAAASAPSMVNYRPPQVRTMNGAR